MRERKLVEQWWELRSEAGDRRAHRDDAIRTRDALRKHGYRADAVRVRRVIPAKLSPLHAYGWNRTSGHDEYMDEHCQVHVVVKRERSIKRWSYHVALSAQTTWSADGIAATRADALEYAEAALNALGLTMKEKGR